MYYWILLQCFFLVIIKAEENISGHTRNVLPDYSTNVHSLSKRQEFQEKNIDSCENENQVKAESRACKSKECERVAKFIKLNMNETANPCNDFYEYACGNYAINNPVPATENHWTMWNVIKNNIAKQIKEILEIKIESCDILPVRLAKKWYRSCMDQEAIEKRGTTPLIAVLDAIGGWPIAMETDEWSEKNYNWTKVDKYYGRLVGKFAFFHLLTSPVIAPREIYMFKPELPFSSEIELDIDRDKIYDDKAYKKLIEKAAEIIARERGAAVSPECITKDAEDIVEFERSLYHAFTSFLDADDDDDSDDYEGSGYSNEDDSDADEGSGYSNENDSDIFSGSGDDDWEDKYFVGGSSNVAGAKSMQNFPNFETDDEDFYLLIKGRRNVHLQREKKRKPRSIEALKEKMKITLKDLAKYFVAENDANFNDFKYTFAFFPTYLDGLTRILKATPSRTIVNYIHWNFVSEMLKYTTSELRAAHFDAWKHHADIEEMQPRYKFCIDNHKMVEATSFLFVRKHFPDEAKEVATDMVGLVQKILEEKISNSTFLNERLRQRTIDKIENIKSLIGYPSWYDNSSAVQEFYRGLPVNLQFFENVVNYKKYESMRVIQSFSEEADVNLWNGISAITLNAFYAVMFNSITITAADFQSPFFALSQPEAINFGIIGYIIGHEISHALGPHFHSYDKNGKKVKWDLKQSDIYEDRMECYVKQYNKYTIKLGNVTKQVNGDLTVEENMADSTSINVLYKAYKLWMSKRQKKDVKLPGLENLSDEQLFFMSTAFVWCENFKPKYFDDAINDVHSPKRIRVIGALSNSKDFSEAFECPVGSPMNPEEKCDVWQSDENFAQVISAIIIHFFVKMFRWFLIFCLGTRVSGRTLLDSLKDDTIFVDSNLSDFPLYKLHVPNNVEDDKRAQSSVICQTEKCEKMGKFLLGNMNRSINPCDDFYEYACGNWNSGNPIPFWTDRWNLVNFVPENVRLRTREILDAKEEPKDILPVKLAKKWYRACMNEESIKDKGLSSIVSIVSTIGGWPLANKDGKTDLLDKSFKEVDKYYTNIIGVSTFIDYRVIAKYWDDKYNKSYIRIGVPRLPFEALMGKNRGVHSKNNSYKQLIIKIAKRIAKKTATSLSPTKLSKDVDDLINFEEELYKIQSIQDAKAEENSLSIHREGYSFYKDKDIDHDRMCNEGDTKEVKSVHEDCIVANKISFNEAVKKLDQSKHKRKKDIIKKIDKKNKFNAKLNRKSKDHRSSSHQNFLGKAERLLSRLNRRSKRRDHNKRNSQQVDNFKRQQRDIVVNDKVFERANEGIDERLDPISLRLKLHHNKKNKIIQTKTNKKHKLNNATENDDAAESNSNLKDNHKKDNNAKNEDYEEQDESVNCVDSNDDYDCSNSENDSGEELEVDELDFEKLSSELTALFKECYEDLLNEIDVNQDDVYVESNMNENQLFEYINLLEKTPNENNEINIRISVNYIHWNFISRAFLLTYDMACSILNCAPNYKTIARWKYCIEDVKMSEVISYEYVRKYFRKEDSEVVNNMIEVMKTATKIEIEKSNWMNEDMKKDVKEKIDKMKKYIGYPKWIDNNTAVENYYRGLKIVYKNFDYSLSYERFKTLRELRKLSQEMDAGYPWNHLKPTAVNAYFLPWDNALAVPAADFQFPYFSTLYPDAVNFGFLGYLISHEISHGFDYTGRKRDKNGKKFEWDEQMDKEYMSRAECFHQQYSSFSLETDNGTVQVDGNKTLDENIADCAGIYNLYKAFKLWRMNKGTPDAKLPGLEEYTEDQMFFHSAAAAWCDIIRPSKLVDTMNIDVHTIGRFRVLGGLSNSEDFSKAFSCPVGSKMNPEKKCNIWK
ncbi:uncharacterized protein [Prorops nasuta]|uniref:uncharacterized protein n=1 Tax=Prorops nasuta TaxID=863751 RepID=UPI0034D00A1D